MRKTFLALALLLCSALVNAQQRPPLMAGTNEPVGTGVGIHPGRVAWVHCSGVASWDGNTGLWVEDRWNSQDKADLMVRQAVMTIAGEKTAKRHGRRCSPTSTSVADTANGVTRLARL